MLHTDPHFSDADGFYEALIAAHNGLSSAQSHALNARLVLLLANHIGQQSVLQAALDAARHAADASPATGPSPGQTQAELAAQRSAQGG